MPPMSSADGNSLAVGTARPAPLLTAGMMLAERGIFGMVWADETLEVTARYGRLVDFVDVGDPVTAAVLPLIGLEDDIRALATQKGAIIDLPGVSIIGDGAPTPKVNISVFWSEQETCFLVLLTRHSARSDLEVELSRQIRARLIAEAAVTHKSKELTRANAELARANRDLEEFATIISHDLKAPMRLLRYMIDEFESELGSEVSAAAADKLASMRLQSRRMGGMLSALLEYSSAGRKDDVAEAVDTQALVSSIVRSMGPPPGFEVEITGLWPQIETLAAPLDLVLRNLIDNAIKHHDRDRGRIVLSCNDRGDVLLIGVSDDGPGIAPAEHAAAFLPFRRLSSARQEGQGMGLALVRRWVEAAGGQLSLSSDPSRARGTAFTVTWPKALARISQRR